MFNIIIVISIIFFLIYSINLTGLKIGKFVLTTSCIKDEPIDIVFWVIYLISLLLLIFMPGVGKYVYFGFMLLGFFILAMNHYRFFFKVSKKKLDGYNQFFANTHHIIPASDTKLVPDTFHILIFVMNFINLILAGICLVIV